jgi:hypothetical protein
MGKLAVRALRAVLVVVFGGTVLIQAGILWTLVSGSDPEDGSSRLAAMRVITVVGMLAVQVALVCVWRLVTMVRRGTVFSDAAFRYVDGVIGAIVAAALVWFAVAIVNAPGQRDDRASPPSWPGSGWASSGLRSSCTCCGCCSPRP